MASGVEIIGMDELLAQLKDAPLRVNVAVRRSVATLTREARDEVKAATPVDTGNLKRSIAVKGAKPKNGLFSYAVIARQNGGKSGSGYHYHIVEYGSVKMSARRFAAPIRQKYTGSGGSGRLSVALEKVVNKEIMKRAAS